MNRHLSQFIFVIPMAPINKAAANKIKMLRNKHCYTQAQVADMLYMSQNAYSELECGKTNITLERLQQVAAIYDVSVQYILEEITKWKCPK